MDIIRRQKLVIMTALVFVFAGRAMAQADSRVIPPPPRIQDTPTSTTTHQAEQDLIDPERAFDSTSGQNLYWDCVKKTWVDAKNGKALGFNGVLAKDGEVVPPPPRIQDTPTSTTTHQAKQDLIDPERAFDSTSGQNLYWDRNNKTWKDAKTGKPLGFLGVLKKKPCPPPATTTIPPTPTPPPPVEHASSGVPARFDLGLGYSYMHADAEVVQNLNGFNVSGFYNINSWLAFGGEFSGLSGTGTQNYTDGSVKTSLDRYLYLFGPQVMVHPCDRTTVYGRVLAGGVHDENKISSMGDT